jgi:thiol-disulfide isomerase/thioredoxin
MRSFRTILLLLSVAFAGESVRSKDVAGKAVTVPVAGKATVLLFIGTDCPISNRMAPELARIVAAYPTVKFFFVYADKTVTAKAAKEHQRSFDLPGSGLVDSKLAVARFAKATVTPEAALFDPKGKLIYHGRINDTYVEHNKPSPKAAKNDLREAISAMLAGRAVTTPYVAPVGCRIPF